MSIFFIVFYGYCIPLESRHCNRMAMFDETVTICILYMLMLFSDFLPNAGLRSRAGETYIVIVCVYAATHMMFMYYDTIRSTFIRARYFYRWRHHYYHKYRPKVMAILEKIRAKVCPCCCKKQEEKELEVIVEVEEEEYDSEEEKDEESDQE